MNLTSALLPDLPIAQLSQFAGANKVAGDLHYFVVIDGKLCGNQDKNWMSCINTFPFLFFPFAFAFAFSLF